MVVCRRAPHLACIEHNTLLFAEIKADACTSPECYENKVNVFVAKTVAAKPKLVQITRAYGKPEENSSAIPRNQYVEIRAEKPTNEKQRDWPEYKTCKYTTEAIVTDGSDKGELRRICANADCPVHHPKKATKTIGRLFFSPVTMKSRSR